MLHYLRDKWLILLAAALTAAAMLRIDYETRNYTRITTPITDCSTEWVEQLIPKRN